MVEAADAEAVEHWTQYLVQSVQTHLA
jgi:hypothetical protein